MLPAIDLGKLSYIVGTNRRRRAGADKVVCRGVTVEAEAAVEAELSSIVVVGPDTLQPNLSAG